MLSLICPVEQSAERGKISLIPSIRSASRSNRGWRKYRLLTRRSFSELVSGRALERPGHQAEIHVKYKGLSIPMLIDKCQANRFDLDEGDRRRIESLTESGRRYVRFKRIGKQLGEMETYL
jgi:hypothetical protein